MPSDLEPHLDTFPDPQGRSTPEEKDYKEDEVWEPTVQDAFGNEETAEVKYKVLKWWQCGLLMVAETISLGVLSLPAAVATLGLAPALIILIGIGIIATYTGYVFGQFKLRYPHVMSMADAGEVLWGPVGREILGVAQVLFIIFFMASHLVTFTTAFNVITDHGTCSIVFGVVGLIVSLICSLPRTLKNVSWFSMASFISIVASIVICMIGLGIENPGGKPVQATKTTDLVTAFAAVLNIIFAYIGHIAYFGIMAELKDPHDFPKALCLLQTLDISIYIVTAVVIYRYAGDGVSSPALGSTNPILQKVAYGIALPTIVIAGVIFGHVGCKYIYLRLFQGTDRVHRRDFVALGSWIGIATVMWVIAWVIAEAVPVFSNILSLISSLFGSWFSFGLSGYFWLYMNRGLWFVTWRKSILSAINFSLILLGGLICGLGLYTSIRSIQLNPSSASFSCAGSS